MENHHPSTLLSMDSSATSHDELDLEMSPQVILSQPPDINLPLSAERSPPPPNHCDMLGVAGLTPQAYYESESFLNPPKASGRKCAKRVDSIWGASFFFSHYFKPALNANSKAKILWDGDAVSGLDKSDLKLDVFLVQHDMENMYMWVFKERPENALGKMQLRSYMNGHSRQGEHPFPFCVDMGFVRSHRMQRKQYRGLSNPQCVHGIEVVPSPNLMLLGEEVRKRWMELTGRDLNFTIPVEASDYSSWRSLPNTDFELDRVAPLVPKGISNSTQSKKLLNGCGLNLLPRPTNYSNGNSADLSPACNKRKKDLFPQEDCCMASDPPWVNDFSGVMRNRFGCGFGPVTAAKTVYEDEEGYLIMISLPLVDLQRVKVSWRNTPARGIIKLSCVSMSGTPFIKRQDRTFKLVDPFPEHCPSGEFVREIPLATRIPEDSNIEAYYGGSGSVLEISVPKLRVEPEEHEVRVCLRPHLNEIMLT